MNKPVAISFSNMVWLKEQSHQEDQLMLEFIFRGALDNLDTITEAQYRKGGFERALQSTLLRTGAFTSVTDPDKSTICSHSKHTVDMVASRHDKPSLVIEVEKTEVKRVIHDILKIAAFQQNEKDAIGVLIFPSQYKSTTKVYSRTHLQEARDVLQLMGLSHPWQGGNLVVVTYEKE